jgi:hypothetical protein
MLVMRCPQGERVVNDIVQLPKQMLDDSEILMLKLKFWYDQSNDIQAAGRIGFFDLTFPSLQRDLGVKSNRFGKLVAGNPLYAGVDSAKPSTRQGSDYHVEYCDRFDGSIVYGVEKRMYLRWV